MNDGILDLTPLFKHPTIASLALGMVRLLLFYRMSQVNRVLTGRTCHLPLSSTSFVDRFRDHHSGSSNSHHSRILLLPPLNPEIILEPPYLSFLSSPIDCYISFITFASSCQISGSSACSDLSTMGCMGCCARPTELRIPRPLPALR
jgi:hypothetical protein